MSTRGITRRITATSESRFSRSLFVAAAMPGYWIFTHTGRPSNVARCTWPMEAAASGSGSKWSKSASGASPSSSSKASRHAPSAIAVDWVRSEASASR